MLAVAQCHGILCQLTEQLIVQVVREKLLKYPHKDLRHENIFDKQV